MAQALPEWNDAYFLPLVFPLLQPLSDIAQSLLRVEFSLLIMVQHEVFQLFLLVVGFHIADHVWHGREDGRHQPCRGPGDV